MAGVTRPVCHLTGGLTRASGGVIEAIVGMAGGLGYAGRSVEVVGLGQPSDTRELPETLSARAVPALGLKGMTRVPILREALLKTDADIVHQHGLWNPTMTFAVRGWKRRAGSDARVVISPHGMLDPWALANSRWKKRVALAAFERRALQEADCLHALNASELASIRALGLCNPVAVIPNGVHLPDLDAPHAAANETDPRQVLLFLGRLHRKKGIAETMQAWARLIKEEPDIARQWRLVVAGWDDGGHLGTLEKLRTTLGLEAHVGFPGPVFAAEKAALLGNCGAFILASYSEGLPMAVLEAWAHAKPVFMTRACNLPEGFEAGAAIQIDTDPAEIAQALRSHLGEARLQQIGQSGRKLVEARFSWNSVGLRLDAVYAWLSGERPDAPDDVETA
ncbi:glycosyltransferase [Citreimonas sp.]|uniref:glycosyltransferase n=1 Tax=Citreimonas sp. TaxID=3036715 RepID=UPI00405842C6